ncbi:MAG: AI-2E family transporter [Bacteroidota bacterium]
MKNIGKYILIIAIIGLLYVIFRYFGHIVFYILISYILSLVGHPLVAGLGKFHIKNYYLPRALRAAITLIIVWGGIFLFFRVFIPLIAYQANEIAELDVSTVAEALKDPLHRVELFIKKMNLVEDASFSLEHYISNKVIALLNTSFFTDFFSSLINFFGNLFLAFLSISFITFFFLKDDELFAESLLLLVPDQYNDQVKSILFRTKRLLSRYFIGICGQVTSIIILITLGLNIVGIGFNQSLVIALFVGIMNVIPYIGPLIGAFLGLLVGAVTHMHVDFTSELLPMLFYMAIVFGSVQVIDNILFQPLIYSSSVMAHPLEIFLVILVAASIGGVVGMILAVPVYTIARVIAKEFFSNFKVVQKLTMKI